MQARNLKAVRTAFEIGGIEFLDQTGLRFHGHQLQDASPAALVAP
jgi:hypothetical protein